MSKNTENTNLIPLFGRDNDKRVKLFIDELRNQFDHGKFTTVKITNVTIPFQNLYFKGSPAPSTDINKEWVEFANDLYYRLAKTPAAASKEAVEIIKKFNTPSKDNEVRFVQALIRSIFANLTGTGANITDVSTWDKATGATYKSDLSGLFGGKLAVLANAIKDRTVTRDSGKMEFTFEFTKFWLRSMLEAHAASATTAVSPSTEFWADDVVPADEVYYRKGSGSELYTRDASGAEIRVDFGSDEAKKLTVDNKCLNTGFDGAAGTAKVECADYLRECLSGKDVTKCKKFLDDDEYWPKAVDEVKNMLPAIAVQTLNAFEFGVESVWDNTANRRLLKYKSVDSWIKGLVELTKSSSAPLTTTDVDKIAKNKKLIGYLEMLVKKVNTSPGILNKDYNGAANVAKINDINAFAGSRFHRMGVKARLGTNNLSVSSIDRLSQGIKDSNARLSITLGLPGLYGFSSRYTLSGGAQPLEELEEKVSDVTKQTAHIMSLHVSALAIRLKKYGKEISKDDFAKITALIESLKKSEEKLNKAILYTEKYARLLEVYGQKDNTTILSMNHLKEFVDNRNKIFTRVSKKQNDLLSIIRSVAEAVNKETPSPDAEMKTLDVDPKSIDFSSLLG